MRALVVDESSLQRRFVTWLLREFSDLQVTEAADAATALAHLSSQAFDVMTLELKLAKLDGTALLTQLRATPGPSVNVPVVVITSIADASVQAAVRDLGVTTYLTKPAVAARVRDAIAAHLGLSDQRPPAEEQRSTPRLRLSVTVRFGSESAEESQTADISSFGAFILTTTMPEVGSHGSLTMTLPHLDAPLVLAFNVIHVRPQALTDMPQGFGVRFITDNPEAMAKLVKAFETPRS